MKIHNFCAGPSILPKEVFEDASIAVKDYNNSGLSLLEISHRSHAFVEIMDEARDLSLELLNLDGQNYTSLFLQGGASTQFLMTAYNFMKNEAAFLNTGTWSEKPLRKLDFLAMLTYLAALKTIILIIYLIIKCQKNMIISTAPQIILFLVPKLIIL